MNNEGAANPGMFLGLSWDADQADYFWKSVDIGFLHTLKLKTSHRLSQVGD